MDLAFFLKLSLILLVFSLCFWFRKENMRKRD
jgi:hypothetical protein